MSNNFSAESLNAGLNKAGKAKKDEFYTQMVDIEKELKHYKEQFRGKIIYCNCDDPYESNFFKYFASNFNTFGLKKLITTSYVKSKIAGEQLPLFELEGLKDISRDVGHPFRIEITEVIDSNGDGAINLEDVVDLLKHDKNSAIPLSGDGDFRSAECIALLEKADIVVTNPPFSLFREYVEQLMSHNKKFLILGDQNAISYKEIFKFIREDKLWLGYDNNGTKWFEVPDDYDIPTESRKKVVNGIKYFSMGRIMWFTNMETTKRHTKLDLYKNYDPQNYPEFDNYHAIEVSKVAEIPQNYSGAMAVPITFLDKYNPDQFQIVSSNDLRKSDRVPFKEHGLIKDKDGAINGKPTYVRITIKHKDIEASNEN